MILLGLEKGLILARGLSKIFAGRNEATVTVFHDESRC